MLLTLDIGNTTIGIYGLVRGEAGDYQIIFQEKLLSSQGTADYYPQLKKICSCLDKSNIEGVAYASVAPAQDMLVARAVTRLLTKTPVKIRPIGLKFAFAEIDSVGLDRVAEAAWVARRYSLPALIVDMGTATTFNVLDKQGVFLGGMISPGVETSMLALHNRTAQLPIVDLFDPVRLIGRDTGSCIRSGIINGTAAQIDGLASRVEKELKEKITLILTGGWANLVIPFCKHPYMHDPLLLPKGIAFLYDLCEGVRNE